MNDIVYVVVAYHRQDNVCVIRGYNDEMHAEEDSMMSDHILFDDTYIVPESKFDAIGAIIVSMVDNDCINEYRIVQLIID